MQKKRIITLSMAHRIVCKEWFILSAANVAIRGFLSECAGG